MAKRLAGERYALLILNALMTHDGMLPTNQLCDMCGCERKTVYKVMTDLELSGFGISIVPAKGKRPNLYGFNGLFGRG